MSDSKKTTTNRVPKLVLFAAVAVIPVLTVSVALIVFTQPKLLRPSSVSPVQMRAALAAMIKDENNQSLAPIVAPAQAGWCWCVTYFLNKLNNGQHVREGYWPTAASMASQDYWNKTVIPRSRSQTAQPGDVIIMQSYAKVYPWNNQTHRWDRYFDTHSIGDGAGHIGIVERADYWNVEGGWLIWMRSANWGTAWGSWEEEAGCNDVSTSAVFVPNGDPVSFWRAR